MRKPHNDTKQLLKGAFILTIAAVIIKLLSAIYRVPFQNIVGDVGFYIYQQVYPFYGIAIVLSTIGFPVIISKLYAEYGEKNDVGAQRVLIQAASIVLTGVALLLFTCLFFFAETIALWMSDVQLIPLIQAVSFVFLFMPFIALLRGMYQGRGDMVPTAVSQVAEQFVRVAAILIVAFILVNNGYSLYETGTGAVYSSVAGLLASTCVLLFFFIVKKEWRSVAWQTRRKHKTSVSLKQLIKVLLVQGTAVCVSGMMLILLQLVDSLNLYALLVSSGVDETAAKGLKGVYDRGQPLIQLGTVVATSISLAVIPFIASAKARDDKQQLMGNIRLTLQLSIVVGIGASAGLWSIIEPTNVMLFQNNTGSNVLAVLSLMIALTATIMTMVAILQGVGTMIFPAVIIVSGAVIKYILNKLLVPYAGTIGGAYASVLTLTFILVCLAIKLRRVTEKSIVSKRFVLLTALATGVLLFVLHYYVEGTGFLYAVIDSERIAAALQAISAVMLGALVYVAIIVRSGLFRSDELGKLPFGSKLVLFLPKKYR